MLKWNKILLVSVIYLIIASVIRQIELMFTLDFYKMPAYFPTWSKVMMPKAGPPPTSFLVASFLFTLLTGIALALLYSYMKISLPKEEEGQVMVFTGIASLLFLVFFTLPSYLLFNLPLELLVVWFITGTISILLGTLAFVKILK